MNHFPADYSAVMIDIEDQARLLERFPPPKDWILVATHMTINLGNLSPQSEVKLGQRVFLKLIAVGKDENCLAAKVEAN